MTCVLVLMVVFCCQDLNEAWERLKNLSLQRQERLFGAHEIQHFNRDADETIAWIAEKNTTLSTEDYGRDLASVQALQRKHDGVERDLAALEEKVCPSDMSVLLLCRHCYAVTKCPQRPQLRIPEVKVLFC